VRRLAAIAAGLAAAAVFAAVLAAPARSDGGPYTVRAIFDDAAFAARGEDVRVAGANVGTISALGITSGKRAAVSLRIGDSRFTPFHANAHCEIRPQSLIGEQYVDCDPGTAGTAQLPKISQGPGAGSYLLPVTRTSSPVDTDIVQDISRQPVRQSLAVIIDELGTGLATRGSDLNAVIHRANPALGNTDEVLKILASQSRALAQLATNSDAVLAPLARERRQISGFVTQANVTSVASAQRAADISRTFRLFPSFLSQLRPLMADLGTFADQGTPVMSELGQSASALGRQFANLTPFASAARTALINLGRAASESQPSLVATLPLAQRLRRLGTAARPTASSLQRLLDSLNQTGGIQQLMSLLYEGASATNGFDSLGHYTRFEPLDSSCTDYVSAAIPGCSANFSGAQAASATRDRLVTAAVQTASSRSSATKAMSGLLGYLTGDRR
jgi:phospholipid/cholesterol/gamma-HCH transport system substrate-binding protein